MEAFRLIVFLLLAITSAATELDIDAIKDEKDARKGVAPHGLFWKSLHGASQLVHDAVMSSGRDSAGSCKTRLAHLRSLIATGSLEEALDVSLALEPLHRAGRHVDCHADSPHYGEGTIATHVETPDSRSNPTARSVVSSFIRLHSDSDDADQVLRLTSAEARARAIRGSGSPPRIPVVGFALDGVFVLAKSSIRCWEQDQTLPTEPSKHSHGHGYRCIGGGNIDKLVQDNKEALTLEATIKAPRLLGEPRRLMTQMGQPLYPDARVVKEEKEAAASAEVTTAATGDLDNTYTVGTKTVLVIPLVPTDGDTIDVQTKSEPAGYNYGLVNSAHGGNIRSFLELCMSSNNDFLRDQSWQQFELAWTITPVFQVSYTSSTCGNPTALDIYASKSSAAFDMMAFAAAEAASPTSYLRANYNFNVIFIPKCTSKGFAGIGWVGAPGTLQNSLLSDYDSSVVHELGHNFGANHASIITDGSRGADAFSSVSFLEEMDTWIEYGNPHSTMGQGEFVSNRVDFTIEGKAVLDWVDATEMVNVVLFDPVTDVGNCKPSCGPYYLSPTDASSKPVSATMGISIETSIADRYFFVEFRNAATASTGGPAALITWADITTNIYSSSSTGIWGHTLLTDCTPLTPDWIDAGCTPGTSIDLDAGEPWDSKRFSVVVGDVQIDGTLKVEIVSGGTPSPTVSAEPTTTPVPTFAPSVSLPCTALILNGSYTGVSSSFLGTYSIQGLDSNGNRYLSYGGKYVYYLSTYWAISSDLGSSYISWYSNVYGDSAWPPTNGWRVWNGEWYVPSVTLTCSASDHASSAATVRGGACTVSGRCIKSPNYPSDYGNDERCIFTIETNGTLNVVAFNTEAGFDTLTLKGLEYSGVSGPHGIAVDIGDTLWWGSDDATTASGFSICIEILSTLDPTLRPTPEPTRGPTLVPTPQGPSSLCFVDSKFTSSVVIHANVSCGNSTEKWDYRSRGLSAEEACADSAFASNISLFSGNCCSDRSSVCLAYNLPAAVKDGAASIVISLDVTAAAPPTNENKQALLLAIANELDLPVSSLIGFSVSYVQTSSRRRSLLATYTWTTSFTVQQPVSDSSASDSAFAASVVEDLTSPAFVSAVSIDVGATLDTSSVSDVVVLTPSPSVPIAAIPTSNSVADSGGATTDPSLRKKSPTSDEPGFIIGGASLAVLCLGVFIIYHFRGKLSLCPKKQQQLTQYAGPSDEESLSKSKTQISSSIRKVAPAPLPPSFPAHVSVSASSADPQSGSSIAN